MADDYFIPTYCILPKKCVVKEIFISEWRIGDVHGLLYRSKEQIDLYKADFIICCGTEYAFMDACYKDREVDWKMISRGIWYFRDGL